jgi:hypothetical protein
MQNFGHQATDSLAVPLPATASADQIAAFAMVALDRSHTTLHCRLDVPAAADVAPALQFGPASFIVGEAYACTSPQVFSLRTAGSYALSVWAVDAVGNEERPPKQQRFALAYATGALYARVGGAAWGPTNKRLHTLQLAAVRGTADGTGVPVAAGVGFESSVATLQRGEWVDSGWQAVRGSEMTFKVRTELVSQALRGTLLVCAQMYSVLRMSTTTAAT